MPPGRSFRMVVYGEIVSASNFETEGSKLFVHYFVNLPVGWTTSEATTNSDLIGKNIVHIIRLFDLSLTHQLQSVSRI